EILDAELDARTMGVVESAQAHYGPRGLRCGARSLAFEHGIVVGVATLAPAAVLVLHAFEPVTGLEQPRLIHVHPQRSHAAQSLPGPVNEIHTPAAVPGAVLLLLFTQEHDGLLHLRMVRAEALVPEQLQDARGNVGTLGIEHGVVI